MNITQAEELVRTELGDGHQVVKLGGYWLIQSPKNAEGHRVNLAQRRGSLPAAIADAKAAR